MSFLLIRRTLATKAAQVSKSSPSSSSSSSSSSSVDGQELAKFAQVGSKWWSGEEFRALRNLNQLRVPLIRDTLQYGNGDDHHDHDHGDDVESRSGTNASAPLQGVHLLDIGCGGGILSEALARLGAKVTGLDPVQGSIDAARAHAQLTLDAEQMPEYQCSTIEEFARSERARAHFDGIIASEVLEHVEDLGSFLAASVSCLRPGGHYFITSINQSPLAYLTAILAAEHVLGLLPKGTHEYRKLIPPAGLALLLRDHQCEVLKIHGMCLNPLNLRWTWSQSQLVNYALLARRKLT